jgi:hypothetical protein
MELYNKVDKQTKEYYIPAFEALDELVAKISSDENQTNYQIPLKNFIN